MSVRSSGRLAANSMAILLLACGGGSDPPAGDAGSEQVDGAVSCTEVPNLVIGHCLDGATGEPCLDFESTQRQFHEIGTDVVIDPIVGLQGSDMFVLAVRGQGIAPGTEETPTEVEVAVWYQETEIGGYAAWPEFEPDGDEPSLMVAPQLYVVVFQAAGLQGQSVSVEAEVLDSSGNRYCTDGSFLVGELIDAPPLP